MTTGSPKLCLTRRFAAVSHGQLSWTVTVMMPSGCDTETRCSVPPVAVPGVEP